MQVNALVLGTTHRYKNKYVTTVVYKPRRARSQGAQPSSSAATADGYAPQQQHQDFH